MWQCPERGDPHFYFNSAWLILIGFVICVNALKGATRISTVVQDIEKDDVKGVNALKGATRISTCIYLFGILSGIVSMP